MTADPVMLELIRGVKADIRAVHMDVRDLATRVATIEQSDSASVNRLAKKWMPWFLAALGLGGGSGVLVGQQTAGGSHATKDRYVGIVAGVKGPAAGITKHPSHHQKRSESGVTPQPGVGRGVVGSQP